MKPIFLCLIVWIFAYTDGEATENTKSLCFCLAKKPFQSTKNFIETPGIPEGTGCKQEIGVGELQRKHCI